MRPPQDFLGPRNTQQVSKSGGFGPGKFAPGGSQAVISAALMAEIRARARVKFLDEACRE
jgi:hypothetical protein